MHVIEPAQFKTLPKRRKTKKRLLGLVIFLLLAGLTYGGLLYYRPLPPVNAEKIAIPVPSTQNVNLLWPGYGQAALAADGFGLLANHGAQTPAPIASTAKLITALAIIKQKPLAAGQTGPTITLTGEDVNIYQDYYARAGSVVAVQEGEKLSQYQALQALLLPSANNMADSLVQWAFGSVDDYVAYANQMTSTLGMNNTKVSDASGFSPDTRSTATDLVILVQAILKEPVIMEIVGQKEATIPVEGLIQNTNRLLGQEGIIGIKTGNTDEAGGCFLLAAKHTLSDGETVTIVSAIIGAPTLGTAMNDSLALLKASYAGFKPIVVMHKNQPVATYQTAWGNNASAVLSEDVEVVNWIGRPINTKTVLRDVTTPAKSGLETADVKLVINGSETTVKAILNQSINNPSPRWRLARSTN